MSSVNEFICSMFVASLLAVIAERLTPEAMNRYVRLIVSLILLLLVITPLQNLCREFVSTLDESLSAEDREEVRVEEGYDVFLRQAEKAAEKSLRSHLREEFGIVSDVGISLTLSIENETTVTVTSVKICLEEEYADQAANIQEYVQALFSCPVEVSVMEEQQE